jgi:hypothetical protein
MPRGVVAESEKQKSHNKHSRRWKLHCSSLEKGSLECPFSQK